MKAKKTTQPHDLHLLSQWDLVYSRHAIGNVPQTSRLGGVAEAPRSTWCQSGDPLFKESQITGRLDWSPIWSEQSEEEKRESTYSYSQLEHRIDYMEAAARGLNKVHLGQLKLFYCELLFLSLYSHLADTILYIGAAEGYHTGFMAKLFPDHTFHLYDPRPFDIPERDNVVLHQQLFTDADMKDYRGQKLLLITDIRNAEFREHMDKEDQEAAEAVILRDLKLQEGWVRGLRPAMSSIKMRLPYVPGKTETLDGTAYLQPYGPASTETRLHVSDPDSSKVWDHQEYDERMAYFNLDMRPGKHDCRWGKLMDSCGLKHSWDNSLALSICHLYLHKRERDTSGKSVCKLFRAVLSYHRRRYGRKYDVVLAEGLDASQSSTPSLKAEKKPVAEDQE